jgi:hypothetical protein
LLIGLKVAREFEAQFDTKATGIESACIGSFRSPSIDRPSPYRYRHLGGWREKEGKGAMIFGRCFEAALAAYFAREYSTLTQARKRSLFEKAIARDPVRNAAILCSCMMDGADTTGHPAISTKRSYNRAGHLRRTRSLRFCCSVVRWNSARGFITAPST